MFYEIVCLRRSGNGPIFCERSSHAKAQRKERSPSLFAPLRENNSQMLVVVIRPAIGPAGLALSDAREGSFECDGPDLSEAIVLTASC